MTSASCGLPPSMAVSTGLLPRAEKRIPSPEPVRAREAAGDEPAGGAAGAEPGGEVGFGADAAFALPPGQPVGEAEHLATGETTRFVALQDDTSAACHQRDLVELYDQHFAVVADKGDGVADLRLHAHPSDGAF